MHFKKSISLFSLTAGLVSCASAEAGEDAGDIIVARTASGQLTRDGFNADATLTLLTATDGGWSESEPGFDHLIADEPASDLFRLEAGCRIMLEAVALDPALLVVQNGTLQIMDGPGDRLLLRPAGPDLHEHLLFFVDSTSPDYDSDWGVWHATVRLVDTGTTTYAPSVDFTLKFANRAIAAGDMNCDGFVTVADIGGFVQALVSPPDYAANFPACDYVLADINADTFVTVADIGGFVALLTGG